MMCNIEFPKYDGEISHNNNKLPQQTCILLIAANQIGFNCWKNNERNWWSTDVDEIRLTSNDLITG